MLDMSNESGGVKIKYFRVRVEHVGLVIGSGSKIHVYDPGTSGSS